MTTDAYPLAWPPGWKRANQRARAKFLGKVSRSTGEPGGWSPKQALTIEQAMQRLRAELRRFGVSDSQTTISTNLRLRQDGCPMSGQAQPQDPGVAVYWKDGKQSRCIATDRYTKVQDNIAAIAATLEAMRAIERHGGAEILDRAFTGFAALPAPEQPWQVLGLDSHATKDQVREAYRRLARDHHPDRGGDEQQMMRINSARDALLAD
jgi:hypothetical protein